MNPLNTLLGKGAFAELTAQSQSLDTAAQRYWLDQLVPRLSRLAQVNCDRIVQQGGPDTTAVGT